MTVRMKTKRFNKRLNEKISCFELFAAFLSHTTLDSFRDIAYPQYIILYKDRASQGIASSSIALNTFLLIVYP